MRGKAAILGGMILASLFIPVPGGAAGDPYAADSHRLVPFADTTQRVYTSGPDVWQVWVCDVPGWTSVTDVQAATNTLQGGLSGYFQWLSEGDYSPSFVTGGTVSSNDAIPAELSDPESIFAPECESAVSNSVSGSPNGVIIVVNAGFDAGYATVGAVCPELPFTGCTETYPANARRAVVGGAAAATVAPFTEPRTMTAAHEVGHALNWAHSYSGLTKDPITQLVSRYDNPMDVMSGEIHTGAPIGTHAYNRYAAGWIDPDEVAIHSSGINLYQIHARGDLGLEMVVIPGDQEGHFFILGTRRRTSHDILLPTSGVEVYEVDQRRELACAIPSEWPQTWPCFATLIRIKPVPAQEGVTSTVHVMGIDDELSVGGFTLRVIAADATSYTVRVSEVDSGRFVDDDGNLHEPNIEAIAAAGLTNGCNPPENDRYCPAQSVTRGEMAAFLIRALGEEPNMPPYQGYFSDVAEGEWYAPYVERLFELGITNGNGDGTYGPDGIVSRSEMAAFLVRAFDQAPLGTAQGLFEDIPIDAWYIEEAERLLALEITKGCSSIPLLYCPTAPVRRDQMASFLARALGITP